MEYSPIDSFMISLIGYPAYMHVISIILIGMILYVIEEEWNPLGKLIQKTVYTIRKIFRITR